LLTETAFGATEAYQPNIHYLELKTLSMFVVNGPIPTRVQQYSSMQRNNIAHHSIPQYQQLQQQGKNQQARVQESAKEEGAHFQWTPGQGIDFSDTFRKGRYETLWLE
jgi:hypothetical protein